MCWRTANRPFTFCRTSRAWSNARRPSIAIGKAPWRRCAMFRRKTVDLCVDDEKGGGHLNPNAGTRMSMKAKVSKMAEFWGAETPFANLIRKRSSAISEFEQSVLTHKFTQKKGGFPRAKIELKSAFLTAEKESNCNILTNEHVLGSITTTQLQ